MRLSEEQVLKNKEIVEKLIETFPSPRKEQVQKMFEVIGGEYFTTPASSREDFHGCFPGGLADHSLRVTKYLRRLAFGGLENEDSHRWNDSTLNFLGLMHDLGKVGDPPIPLYVPNPSLWHRQKGMLFETNKELDFMPVCDRSMYLLQKYGIALSPEEYIAIRISDGPYEKCNEKYAMKEPDLAVLLHFADRYACQQEKTI